MGFCGLLTSVNRRKAAGNTNVNTKQGKFTTLTKMKMQPIVFDLHANTVLWASCQSLYDLRLHIRGKFVLVLQAKSRPLKN